MLRASLTALYKYKIRIPFPEWAAPFIESAKINEDYAKKNKFKLVKKEDIDGILRDFVIR